MSVIGARSPTHGRVSNRDMPNTHHIFMVDKLLLFVICYQSLLYIIPDVDYWIHCKSLLGITNSGITIQDYMVNKYCMNVFYHTN